jgi:tetratricopeptide (TPR) repeat protein
MIEYQYVDDPVTRAIEVLKNLKELANKSSELLKKEYFKSYIETKTLNVTEESFREVITELEGSLTFALADYRLHNGELNEASKLFNEAAEIGKNIEDWDLHFASRNRALDVEVVKAGSINEYVNVASDLEKLWYEALKHFIYVAPYLEATIVFLGDYLIYLASVSRYDDIEKTLSKYGFILNYREDVFILIRLMLRLLGFAKEVAEIKPEELIESFGANNGIYNEFLPALKLALGIKASVEECESIKDLDERLKCIDAFLAVKGNSYALEELKKKSLNVELLEIAQGLDGKELVQLLAPKTAASRLAFMLYALVNGNVKLAKKHAHLVSKMFPGLRGKLFRDAYESCCDISSERFKLVLLKLYHIHF